MSHAYAEQFLLDKCRSHAEAEPGRRHPPNRNLATIRLTAIAHATCVGALLGLPHAAQAQTFEETALFMLSMTGWDRMQDPAAGIVLKDEEEDIRATFYRQTCWASINMRVKKSIYSPNRDVTISVNFGRINPASIARKPFRLPAQTRFEADGHFISFVMPSGDGERICERSMIIDGMEIHRSPDAPCNVTRPWSFGPSPTRRHASKPP